MAKSNTRGHMAQDVQRLLREHAGRPLKPKEIAKQLGVSTRDYRDLKDVLAELVDAGKLYRVKRGRYAPPEKINVTTGRFVVGRRGARILPDDRAETALFVPFDRDGGALDGDRVAGQILARGSGPLPEGEVIRVLERAHEHIVGTLHVNRDVSRVAPLDPQIRRDCYVSSDRLGGAEEGDVVVVDITSYGDSRRMMRGEIREVLGKYDSPGVDVLVVLKEFGLPTRFPGEVDEAAKRLPKAPREADFANRVDMRTVPTFTIDPAEAKDFDDALSIERREDGTLDVGIHIADVSHYVETGSVIDQEAYRRATSVYLVDRVIPMLPEQLSNELCSLVPNEDRLAFSVLLRLDASVRIRSVRFARTVIRSRRRFAYQDVQALLDGAKPSKADRPFLEPLRDLAALSDTLIERRSARGSLDFDLPGSRVELDESGFPIDIQRAQRLAAHRLVESFMLLANECVAKRLRRVKWPALFRVHEAPDPLATEELRASLARFGIHLRGKKNMPIKPTALQAALAESSELRAAEVVHTLVLRSMKRALYDTSPDGHFGLATTDYTHFTSPIRRYPDLVVHRVMKAYLGEGKPPYDEEAHAESVAQHCSERERVAEEAERTSVELKKVQFMSRKIGERFQGRIVAVTGFGFFVELDRYHVSGLVHLNRLEDDYYLFDAERLSLLGERTGRQFRIGDAVTVDVARTDLPRRQIDFDLVDEPRRKR